MNTSTMQSAGHPVGRPTLATVPRGIGHDPRMSNNDSRDGVLGATGDVCAHAEYTTLRNYRAGPMDDHEHLDAQCQTCGELIRVTIWYSRDDVDMRPLTDEEGFVYEEAERERKRVDDGPRDCSPMLTVFNDGSL
jgi:hypothetical protein